MLENKGDAPANTYRRYLEAGKLGFQRCSACGSAVFYPRVICPACGSSALHWQESTGRGAVYAATAVRRRGAEPYSVCLVDLDEGFRMMSSVEEVPPDEVRVGLRVTLRITRHDGDPIAVFVPEAG